MRKVLGLLLVACMALGGWGTPPSYTTLSAHVQVVLLSPYQATRDMYRLRRIMGKVEEFFAPVGLDVTVDVKGLVRGVDWRTDKDTLYYDLMTATYYDTTQGPDTVYFALEEARLTDENKVGYAWKQDGVAVVAMAWTEEYVALVMEHELGHLWGLEHEERTFMQEDIREKGHVITEAQVAVMRGAHE